MTWLRHPRFSFAALAVYLAVNIGVGAVHHHGEVIHSAKMSPGDNSGLRLQSTSCTDNDSDDDSCLLCRVLHLARTLSLVIRVEGFTPLAGETLLAVAIARPHVLETATHSRAPPMPVCDQ
jgi:hypothetical protein